MYQSMWYAPGMEMGAARPYIGTICYSSAPTLEQAKEEAPMARVQHTRTSAPAPSADSEHADSEPSGMATLDTTGNTFQGSLDQPALLRHGTHATWNQLPGKYCNFALLANASLPSILDAWVCLCICLHLISGLYTIFIRSIV